MIILRPCAVTIPQTARRAWSVRSCSCLARPALVLGVPPSLSGLDARHENCYISESLLTSGLWLQQLMESFPPARLAHSFDSANQLAVPADHSIKSSFHFVFSLSPSFFSALLSAAFSCSAHSARRTALAVIFSKCFLRFIIKIWLAAIAALFEFMCRQTLPDYGCGCRCPCLFACLPVRPLQLSLKSGNLSYSQREVQQIATLVWKLLQNWRNNLITLMASLPVE